jgi:UDP-3-O-[3-hydroxymyristoyl] glucosamine N-acyltransferase
MNEISDFSSIDESVKLGKNCIIGPHVSIEENCVIGDNVVIGAFTHIYYNTQIEDNVEIGSHCNIGVDGFGYAQNQKGESFFTPQIGNVVLKRGAKILDHCSIDRAAFSSTIIGENTILGGHSHIAHNLEIGKDGKIAPGFVVAGSTKIGDRVALDGRVNCVGHIKICDDFSCAAMALINNSVNTPGRYSGSLLKPIEEWKEIEAGLKEIAHHDLEELLEDKNA